MQLAIVAVASGTWVGGCSPAAPSVPVVDAPDADAPLRDDPCLHGPPGPPQVTLGHGQSDYAPLDDGQTVQVQKGPQGGYHIWLAVRMTNLRQSGSRTVIDATDAVSGEAFPRYDVVFTFDPDEGGFCKLFGLRFRVDSERADGLGFLGHALDLEMQVTDTTGAAASSIKRVVLSADVI